MSKKERYIALFDILGFKNIVEKNMLDDIVVTFTGFQITTDILRTVIEKTKNPVVLQYKLFSDSIIVYTHDSSTEALEKLLTFCKMLVSYNFLQGLMLRGAITKGEGFISEEIFIGQPIVRAYLMEQEQEWVGCWIEDQCIDLLQPEVRDKWENTYFVRYAIPLKSGAVGLKWVLNWGNGIDLKTLEKNANRIFYTYSKPEDLTWDVKRKFDNTKAFLCRALLPTSHNEGTT